MTSETTSCRETSHPGGVDQAVEECRNLSWKHFFFLFHVFLALSLEGADPMDMVLPKGWKWGRDWVEFSPETCQGALETWRSGGCAIALTGLDK